MYSNIPPDYATYTGSLVDLGEVSPARPFMDSTSGEKGSLLAIHGWTLDEGIFARKERHISNGCVRVPNEMMNLIDTYVPKQASVYITKTIPPLEAFPLPASNSR
jgi:hypothetical protein